MPDKNAGDILLDLKKNFLDDKRELQEKIVEVETRIRECNDFIESLSKKDDCDYNMFSPRSAQRVYKDQVYEKKIEIEELEEQQRVLYKKLANVTKKIDSINKLTPEEIETTVVEYTEKQEEGSASFLSLQEKDRQRIAADLHDSVLQNLSLVMHNLELAEKFIDYDVVRAKLELESNRKIVKETIEDIRSTIFDLRPMQFDDFGFKKSLESRLDDYKVRTDMDIRYHIDSVDDKDNLVLLSVFRIIQELVINSIKHSKGSYIDVQVMDEGSKIYIEESDDGIGITEDDLSKDNHFGMRILKERVLVLGGTFKLANVSQGTKIIVEIPV